MGRFVLKSRELELDTTVAEFDTFTSAEAYQKALGRTGEHVKLFIVDKKVNTVADAADDVERAKLEKAMAAEKARGELIALQEANNRRAAAVKAETDALNLGMTAPAPAAVETKPAATKGKGKDSE
jgi:hypothetical protein